MFSFTEKTEIEKSIVKFLIQHRSKNNMLMIHTKGVERDIIPNGDGCLSVSRYLRNMREIGMIDYEDPRKNNHYYIIKLNKKLFDWYKSIKK
jgi:hypothetical protein